jgi:5-methylcytosine-specific restriction endonuclease McrA
VRCLEKLSCPSVLIENQQNWLKDYLQDKNNNTHKFRYRHPDIKAQLKAETGWKCIYCESKIGHNTPGDIEHKNPSSKVIELHFEWINLTIACTECNRRKNDYFNSEIGFLDPYNDDVEGTIEHHGPMVTWVSGNRQAEISIKILELNTDKRLALIVRKFEKLNEFFGLLERWHQEEGLLKNLLWKDIEDRVDRFSEFSGMLLSVLKSKGLV